MKKYFTALRGLMGFVRLVRRPRLDDVFRVTDVLARNPGQLARMTAALSREESTRDALETRPAFKAPDLTALQAYPEGSLGREYAKFLVENKLNPGDFPALPAGTSEEYVVAHLYETHDLWHSLTGFDTSVEGEVGLQAFYLAQLPGRLSAALIAAALLNGVIYCPDELVSRMECVVRGWTLGAQARPLFGISWNRHWSRPLAEVRAELGLRIDHQRLVDRPSRTVLLGETQTDCV